MASTKPTILIVDPCSMTRQCMTVLLNAKKFMTISASSIRDATEIIKVHQPDLIIHELALPDGHAKKLIQQARAALDTSPAFLLLTDEIDQSKHLEVLEERVVQAMIKREFMIKLFYAKVESLLGKNRYCKINKAPHTPKPRQTGSGPKIRSEQDREELYNSIPPLMSEEQVTQAVREFSELRAMSPTASKVIELTGSEDATLETVAEAIRSDPAIAVKIIRIANSAAFARTEPVTTPLEAVRRLGLEHIRQNVINLEIIDTFSGQSSNTIDPRLFWEHSIAVGMASAIIARETRAMDPQLAYTAGLLHDIGRIILAQSLGVNYEEAIQFARENHLELDPIEQRMFGIDHASVMKIVLKQWRIGEKLVAPIVHHHKCLSSIDIDCPDRVEPVVIVSLADRLAHALSLGCSGNLAIYPTEEHFQALKIRGSFLSNITQQLPNAVQDMRSAMLGNLGSCATNESHSICKDNALYPVYISRHEETDAIRCWVESLRETEGFDEDLDATNLFVVRLRTRRDATEAENTIKHTEFRNKLTATPIIAISDSSTLRLPESITSTRETRLLTTPFTVDEFQRCVRSIPQLTDEPGDQSQAA